MMMQNWAHVQSAFAAINRLPVSAHDVDFSRVREWALAGLAAHYRQTLLTASWTDVAFRRLARVHCSHSLGGRISFLPRYNLGGALLERAAMPAIKQTFRRISAARRKGASSVASVLSQVSDDRCVIARRERLM